MLISADINNKSFGDKLLYTNLQLILEKGEKVGMIGRNGVGKSTLFGILSGEDKDFDGEVKTSRGTITVSTRQEHIGLENLSVIDYILSELPKYTDLKNLIDNFADFKNPSNTQMNKYSDALDHFGSLGYYEVEESVLRQLATYQISEQKARAPLSKLSGGQKRFAELVKIAHSNADLILIDEPTNHMDYIAKNAFINWVESVHTTALLIITHDRDVLAKMDRIVEIKDNQAFSFNGNYASYLAKNSNSTVNQMKNYEVAQSTLDNLRQQLAYARAKKPSYRGKSANNPWVVMENRLVKQIDSIMKANPKPSLWIDSESLDKIPDKVIEKYHKYKAKNVRINADVVSNGQASSAILDFKKLVLGYSEPLFKPITGQLRDGEIMRLHGRNGAGKTTLVGAIIAESNSQPPESTKLSGELTIRPKTKIGVYQQEISEEFLEMTLQEAIEQIHLKKNSPISIQKIMQIMGDYLFDPYNDAKLKVSLLSGGQKARLQLIDMLASNPNLLILDEPTNHLDLPSIEELETALQKYQGAVLFVSHDSYFVNKFTCTEVTLAN